MPELKSPGWIKGTDNELIIKLASYPKEVWTLTIDMDLEAVALTVKFDDKEKPYLVEFIPAEIIQWLALMERRIRDRKEMERG